jgi:CheY-like chemotaxis protein
MATESTSTATRRLLVIDDYPLFREAISQILRMHGYVVEEAADGRTGLAAIEAGGIDAVLLDMTMPVLDGWAFARAVGERGLSVPIIVMTSSLDGPRWAKEIGAQGYFIKSDNFLRLLALLGRLWPGP